MMKAAQFVYYGRTEDKNRIIRFHKSHGMYVCEVEGMPALVIRHPSYDRVRAAFEGWYQLALKDWGASEIEWNDMSPAEKEI